MTVPLPDPAAVRVPQEPPAPDLPAVLALIQRIVTGDGLQLENLSMTEEEWNEGAGITDQGDDTIDLTIARADWFALIRLAGGTVLKDEPAAPLVAPAGVPEPLADFQYRTLATMLGHLAKDMRKRGYARVNVPKVERHHGLVGWDRFCVDDVEIAQLEAERLARIHEGRADATRQHGDRPSPPSDRQTDGLGTTPEGWDRLAPAPPSVDRERRESAAGSEPADSLPLSAVGRLPALPEPEDRDVLAERFARDPISKDATIERLQALLADVILQRNEFFARLERVEQAACEVLNDQAGRLPALEALLDLIALWRGMALANNRAGGIGVGYAAAYTICADGLELRLAGLRADPAPRQQGQP